MVYFQTFQEPVEKDIKPLITDTVERLVFSLNQSRHQIAVQQELKALLEHEKVRMCIAELYILQLSIIVNM